VTKTLVTSALPYANGPIHLGHLVEYIQTDIYVRFLKSCGEDVIYLCADDTHGAQIEVNAAKAGVPPEEYVKRWYGEHKRDFASFQIAFDGYYSTHTDENRRYAELIYQRNKDAGNFAEGSLELTYCEYDKRFLPDRFVKGTCPNCKSPDQYGDQCEKCWKTYEVTALIDPHCIICGRSPVRRKSDHHQFFKLSNFHSFLKEYVRSGVVEPEVANSATSMIEEGLNDWCVSRDGPYFGFAIPGLSDKYFYVWLDAPIGYISATELWAKETRRANDALAYWGAGADSRIIHVIGKDIVKFHVLFWPAMLKGAGLHLPNKIPVHGHLTVSGEKMSKSRGTFITAEEYLKHLDPSYLRYFYAANLSPRVEDIDLSLKEFRERVNGELINNLGNLFNRGLSLLGTRLEGRVSAQRDAPEIAAAVEQVPAVRKAFSDLEFRTAIRTINAIADRANRFVQARAPWASIGKDPETARRDLSTAADITYLISALLAPIVPSLCAELTKQLSAPPLTFQALASSPSLLPAEHRIGKAAPVLPRIEDKQIAALSAEGQNTAASKPSPPTNGATANSIAYDDFARLELKVGKVLAAERIPKADKLLKLSVDLGEGTPRTIASGIAEFIAPEALIGKNVVVVANLAPRTIRGVESRGMILAAGGEGGTPLTLVEAPTAPPGTKVK
jgi:methionyl-tRNA synthetase